MTTPTTSADQGTTAQQVSRFTSTLIQQSRTLSQRELVISSTALQSKATKLGELYQMLSGSHAKNLDDAVRSMRFELKRQTPDFAILEQVLGAGEGDPAQAHVILQAAVRQARNEGSVDEYHALCEHLRLLRHHHGSRARAGINTARSFARSTLSPRRRQNLRDIYYNGVTGQQSIFGLIETLLEQTEGEREFQPTLHDLRSAIADDLAALAPSGSQQLRTLMHGLSAARYVSTLLQSCEHLLGRMRGKNPALQLSAPTFLKHVLSLSGKGMNINETLQLTQMVGGSQLRHQLSFLNGLRPMLQQLPILLWNDIKLRQKSLSNLLQLMAELTQQEQNLAKGSA